MATSASFTVNSAANPATHVVAYGDTVTCVLQSITGANSIVWEVLTVSHEGMATPDLELSGTPSGQTATFTMVSDPGGGEGRSVVIRCTVRDSGGAVYRESALVGVQNGAGLVPLCPGETTERSSSHGYVGPLNTALAAGSGSLPEPGAEGNLLRSNGYEWLSATPLNVKGMLSGGVGDSTNVSGDVFVPVTISLSAYVGSGLLAPGAEGTLTYDNGAAPITVLVTLVATITGDSTTGPFTFFASIDHEGDTVGEATSTYQQAIRTGADNSERSVTCQRLLALAPGDVIKPCFRVPGGTYSGSVNQVNLTFSVS